jgi:hypothetical protein
MTGFRATFPAVTAVLSAGGATVASVLAMGCCLGPAFITTALVAAGLGGLLSLDLGLLVPLLYGLWGLSLAGIAWISWRCRRWFLLAIALPSSGILLIPFHEVLDVGLFYALVVGGQVGLVAAAGLAVCATRRKSCPSR